MHATSIVFLTTFAISSIIPASFALPAPSSNDVTLFPPSSCPPQAASSQDQEQIFQAYLSIFYNETHPNPTKAMNLYVAANLIQHNPDIKNGRQAQIDAVAPIYKKNDFELQNTFFDSAKGYGIIYNAVYPKGDCQVDAKLKCENSTKVVDMYRFDGGCMVEHWDVLEYPES